MLSHNSVITCFECLNSVDSCHEHLRQNGAWLILHGSLAQLEAWECQRGHTIVACSAVDVLAAVALVQGTAAQRCHYSSRQQARQDVECTK
jgi:hypothetical protein